MPKAQTRSWQLNLASALALWAVVVFLAALYGIRIGLGGPRFATALAVAAALFAFELLLAVPSMMDRWQRTLGEYGGVLAPLVPLFAMLIYAIAVTGAWRAALIGAAYVVVPALLAASSAGKPPGTVADYLAAAIVWLPVEFRWMYRLFSYPTQLMHTLTILLALSTGVAAFVLLRRLDGIGYAIKLNKGDLWVALIHFALFAAIAVTIGTSIGFLHFEPSTARMHPAALLVSIFGIVLFTAWPEEFLFRGVLQNLFARSFKNEWLGLALASVVFGLSHILHPPFPNWKYVLLATIAGFFYGRTWMKTGSLFPAALVHGMVDILWHILFR
jgi:membrane protease YdiL (CAAX protease family)